ncbi:hypothetical protein ANRL1_00646 [Anaerolineae bacterium]|nr:hypothetical protein ANRL1_00646 [Anaerolineae bacterium]
MPSNSPHKPGRNESCWCGSCKKYKACYLRQDEDEAKKAAPITPISSTKPFDLFKPPEPPKPRELSPEELAEQVKRSRTRSLEIVLSDSNVRPRELARVMAIT